MSNGKLLTPEEMFELTGCKQKDGQKKSLEINRIPYLLRADGWPRTTWDAVNARLLGVKQPTQTTATVNRAVPDGFNLGALGS